MLFDHSQIILCDMIARLCISIAAVIKVKN